MPANKANESREDVVEVEVYHNLEELEKVQREWDSFVESTSGDIFLSFDWCRVWWKYYSKKRELRVFVFRRQNKLVGIIPLFFEKLWLGPVYVKTAKILGSDFTMPQFRIPLEKIYVKEIIQRLFVSVSKDNMDILYIGPIAGLYGHYDDLKSACEELSGASYFVLAENNGVQTYFELTDTWDLYLAALNRKERTKIKRHYRLACEVRSDRTTPVVAHCATAEDFEEIFAGFVKMHQKHWQGLNKPGHFEDWPSAYEFHSELAKAQLKKNRLCLMQIKLGNQCIGYKYGYIFGDDYVDFLDARSDCKELANVGLGRIIYSEMIKKAILKKSKWINSMRGKYKHKLEMGGKLLPTRNLYVIPNKSATIMRVRLFRLLARLLNLLYYRIWYLKVACRLPLKRRGLWKIWIRTNAFS
ncbi:MAG: GNAT family N-acetyltransferase [Planctomycetota bacterium]|jgi:CelD/BcsL family acetyltransferase involved in cellulose biosynthesis